MTPTLCCWVLKGRHRTKKNFHTHIYRIWIINPCLFSFYPSRMQLDKIFFLSHLLLSEIKICEGKIGPITKLPYFCDKITFKPVKSHVIWLMKWCQKIISNLKTKITSKSRCFYCHELFNSIRSNVWVSFCTHKLQWKFKISLLKEPI